MKKLKKFISITLIILLLTGITVSISFLTNGFKNFDKKTLEKNINNIINQNNKEEDKKQGENKQDDKKESEKQEEITEDNNKEETVEKTNFEMREKSLNDNISLVVPSFKLITFFGDKNSKETEFILNDVLRDFLKINKFPFLFSLKRFSVDAPDNEHLSEYIEVVNDCYENNQIKLILKKKFKGELRLKVTDYSNIKKTEYKLIFED